MRSTGRRRRRAPSPCRTANCAPALSTIVCSVAASPAVPTTGSCARASSRRRRRIRPGPADAPVAACPAAFSDHRAGTRHLWGGAASGAAIGRRDPRHARRPGRRHLRAGRLRRCACARDLVCRSADQEVSPDQKGRGGAVPAVRALGLGPLLRTDDRQPLSVASPIRARAATWAASRAASTFCAAR